jgi:hypothetical protein
LTNEGLGDGRFQIWEKSEEEEEEDRLKVHKIKCYFLNN